MKDDQIDYKMLRQIQDEEKSSPLLTKLDDHFFLDASRFYHHMLNRFQTEEKPSRNLILSEQTQTIEKIIHSIYEIREKKIMLAALAKVRGGNPSEKHFLPPEEILFTEVYSLLMKNRESLLKDPSDTPTVATKKPEIKEKNVQSEKISESKSIESEKDKRTVIRILKTIPSFIGTDAKQYDLYAHDIVSIPSDLASMLVSRKVAKLVKMTG